MKRGALCETAEWPAFGQTDIGAAGKRVLAVSWSKVKKQKNRGDYCDSESQ